MPIKLNKCRVKQMVGYVNALGDLDYYLKSNTFEKSALSLSYFSPPPATAQVTDKNTLQCRLDRGNSSYLKNKSSTQYFI